VVGRSIVVGSWATLGLFVVTVVPDAAGGHALDGVASGVALTLFLISLPIWMYAFGLAVVRSARGDEIGIGSLFFLVGSAPADVRRWLLGALVVSLVVACATAWANAFAVLEPMLPLALVGLWGARHGTFPPRDLAVRVPPTARRTTAPNGGGR
jgi:uncharacterized MAPEG superfamily protein